MTARKRAPAREVRERPIRATIPRAAVEWEAGNDTGISSRNIWRHMALGVQPDGAFGYPHDPDDFGRCYRLLKAVPEWRERIGEMARYPIWRGLVKQWDRLEALYLKEIRGGTGMAPECYRAMKAAIEAEAFAIGWSKAGEPGSIRVKPWPNWTDAKRKTA